MFKAFVKDDRMKLVQWEDEGVEKNIKKAMAQQSFIIYNKHTKRSSKERFSIVRA